MSTIKVNKIENTATADGGVAIDVDGHVTIDGQNFPTAGPLSNRNLIINGAMQVAQRGTSSTPTAGGYYTVDRFSIRHTDNYMSSVTPTYAQVEEAPSGFKYSQKITIGTGSAPSGNNLLSLEHPIEGTNCSHLGFGTASAQTLTLSFWVRASAQGNYDVFFQNNARDRHYITQYTIAADEAGEWVYKTITIPGDTTGTWLTDNNVGILVGFISTIASGSNFATSTLNAWGSNDKRGSTTCTALAATTGATFQITGVQLEVGSKATPFEHRSYGDELQRCQRYYQSIDFRSVIFNGGSSSSSAAIITNAFTTVRGGTPTVTPNVVYSSTGRYEGNIANAVSHNITSAGIGLRGATLLIARTSSAVEDILTVCGDTSNGVFNFDYEL